MVSRAVPRHPPGWSGAGQYTAGSAGAGSRGAKAPGWVRAPLGSGPGLLSTRQTGAGGRSGEARTADLSGHGRVDPYGAHQIGGVDGIDLDVGAGVGCDHHLTVADVHGHVVYEPGVGGVVGPEEEIPGLDLGQRYLRPGQELLSR